MTAAATAHAAVSAQPVVAEPVKASVAPTASQAQPPQPLWTRDEFDVLAVRVANEPERVSVALELYKSRLINFAMLKDILDIR